MENGNVEFYVDRYIVCKECKNEFCWFAKDQRFIAEVVENQIPHPTTGKTIDKVIAPVRCLSCRKNRKDFFNSKKQK